VDGETAASTTMSAGVLDAERYADVPTNMTRVAKSRPKRCLTHPDVDAVASLDGVARSTRPMREAVSRRARRRYSTGVRMVTNSSAALGWIPRVASSSAFVAPHLRAMARPCVISAASGPTM